MKSKPTSEYQNRLNRLFSELANSPAAFPSQNRVPEGLKDHSLVENLPPEAAIDETGYPENAALCDEITGCNQGLYHPPVFLRQDTKDLLELSTGAPDRQSVKYSTSEDSIPDAVVDQLAHEQGTILQNDLLIEPGFPTTIFHPVGRTEMEKLITVTGVDRKEPASLKSMFRGNINLIVSRHPLMSWVAIFYLAAISLAEALTTLFAPQVGLLLHSLVLLMLLLQAALSNRLSKQRFLLALTLAPLTRLLSLVLPLQQIPLVYWYALTGVPLGIAAIFAARAGQCRRVELGLTLNKLPFQLLFSLTGFGLGYLEYCILRPQPLVMEQSLSQIWLPALILLIFTGLLEEIIFRGLMQSAAVASLGRAGILFTATLFAVMHMGYQSWLDVAFVFAVALLFGWVVQRTGSILGVTLAHGLTNISLFLIFPFLLVA